MTHSKYSQLVLYWGKFSNAFPKILVYPPPQFSIKSSDYLYVRFGRSSRGFDADLRCVRHEMHITNTYIITPAILGAVVAQWKRTYFQCVGSLVRSVLVPVSFVVDKTCAWVFLGLFHFHPLFSFQPIHLIIVHLA